MAKGQRKNCYRPKRATRSGSVNALKPSVQVRPPEYLVPACDLGKAIPNPEQRARDASNPSLGPLLGAAAPQTHTRRLLDSMSR